MIGLHLWWLSFLLHSFILAQNFVSNVPGEIRTSMHTKAPSPGAFDSGGGRCVELFSMAPSYQQRNQNISDMGPTSIQNRELPGTYQPPEVVSVIRRTLNFWASTGFYTKQKIDWLFEREMSLPAIRTHFVEIIHKTSLLAIRIFDGSTRVWSGPLPWYGIPAGDQALTPTERTYGIRFIERHLYEEAYILDLGLLGSPKEFLDGVDVVFDNVANWIDANYNDMNYRTFGDLSLISQRDLQIYGVARPKLADHYRAFGYEPVMVPGPEGLRPITFDDGMILIKVSGRDFIKQHFKGRIFPEVDGRPPESHESWITPDIQALNLQVESFGAVQGLNNMGDFWEVWNQIIHHYDPLFRKAQPGSEEAAIAYRRMVEGLYQLYKAPVYHENNHPAVAAMRVSLLKQLLTMPPEQGWSQLQTFVIGLELARHAPENFEWVTLEED